MADHADHPVADLVTGDALADLGDVARDLMARREGRGGLNWYLSWMMRVSGKLTPAAFVATRTCPLPTGLDGISTSFRLSGPPGVSLSIARIVSLPIPVFHPVAPLIR